MDKTLKSVVRLAVFAALMLVPVIAQADNEAWVEYQESTKTLTFRYDDQKESAESTAKYSIPSDTQTYPDWLKTYGSDITKVVFDSSFANYTPTCCYFWFFQLANLNSIVGIENLNTSEVTTMEGMFAYCSSLTDLNLTTFDTSKVTSMVGMFCGCSSLVEIYVSDKFVVSDDCEGDYMFEHCTSLPGFDATKTDASMANTTGGYFSKWDPNAAAWAEYDATTQTLTFYYNGQRESSEATNTFDIPTSEDTTPQWSTYSENITKVVFDKSFASVRPTTCKSWFNGMKSLTDIENLKCLNTSEVTDMSSMFAACASLTSLDVTSFSTSAVTSMQTMFMNCTELTTLDLSNFDVSAVTDMKGMFISCQSLETIYVSDGFKVSDDCAGDNMFCDCTSLKGYVDTKTGKEMANYTDGYLTEKPTAWAEFQDSTKTLTFHYDCNMNSTEATDKYVISSFDNGTDWCDNHQYDIEKVVFDENFYNFHPYSCASWFAYLYNLSSIEGIENLNTSEVTSMAGMFNACSKLDTLDLSHFDTSAVKDMSYMFCGCKSLTYLDVSFDTSNVNDMSYMFQLCQNLTELNVSSFVTSNVTNMEAMFDECSSLKELDLSTFSTANVRSFYWFLRNCISLTKVDVSCFNTENARSLSCMFASCSSLKDIDVSSFNTSNVTDMGAMFGGCSGLTSIDVSSFITSNVTDMGAMFSGCKGLTSLDISNFKTASVRDASSMFGGCSNLKNIYVHMNFSLPSIKENRNMFGGCTSLPGFNSDSIDAAKANYTDGYLTLRRKFWVGSNKYNADGVDAVCYDNVEFGDKDDFFSTFNFSFDTDNYATYERTVSSNWATLCLPFSFTPASNKGINCYRISNIGTDVITVDKIEDVIAAGEPILVYTTTGNISVTGTAGSDVVKEPVTSDYLTGTFEEAEVIGYDTNYIISKNKFWNVESLLSQSGASSVKMAPYRAYITFIEDEDTEEEDESKAACLDIMINETDGISSVNATDSIQSLDGAEFYNAQGRHLAAPERGLVIVKKGGITRKMIVK